MYIKLRKDGWFEYGKDCEKSFPCAYRCYQVKQTLKKALEEIGKVQSIGELEEKLSKIPEVPTFFKRKPYLRGKDIIIDAHGLPGEAYLGIIKG